MVCVFFLSLLGSPVRLSAHVSHSHITPCEVVILPVGLMLQHFQKQLNNIQLNSDLYEITKILFRYHSLIIG